jgi:hypothetical protein
LRKLLHRLEAAQEYKKRGLKLPSLYKEGKMQFKQYGRYLADPKTLINPRRLIQGILLRRLNYLIGFLAEGQPHILTTFIDRLTVRLTEIVSAIPPSEMPFSIEDYPHLQDNQMLVSLHWRFCLLTLGLTADQVETGKQLDVSSRRYHRALLLPRYYYLEILARLLGKPVAVELFKYYLDQYLLSVKEDIPKDEDLDDFMARQVGWAQENSESGWLVTVGKVEKGRVVFRNDNCLWVDALDDLEDRDFIYLVCCHGDFQVARLQNENFEMTRPLTIAMGDPICDKVFHDKRIVEKVIHPPQEFWDHITVEVPDGVLHTSASE